MEVTGIVTGVKEGLGMSKRRLIGYRFLIVFVLRKGAFVDVGLEVSGLLHISDMSTSRVSSVFEITGPREAIKAIVKQVTFESRRQSWF